MQDSPTPQELIQHDWLPPGGEAGALVRSLDWSRTPLGPLSAWPFSLRAAVGLVLGTALPMSLLWGDELVQLYNDAFRPLLGTAHPRAMGRSARQRRPADRLLHERIRQQLAADREPVRLSLRLAGEDSDAGGSRYISACFSAVPGESGDVAGMLAACLDDSASIAARRSLQASDARYRTLFESIDEGFCVIEMLYDERREPVDYRFVEVNPAFEQHTGLVGAVGHTVRELVPRHDAHWFLTYGNVAWTGEPVRFRAHAEAMGRWYDVYAFRYGRPELRQVAALFTDVTAQVRTEAQLSAGHHRFQALSEALERLSCAEGTEALLRELEHAARVLIGADGVALCLDADEFSCVSRGAADALAWERGPRPPLFMKVTEWVMAERRTVVIPDVRTEARVSAALREVAVERGLAMVPVGGEVPTGAVGAYWLSPHCPGDDDVTMLEVVARVAGAALARQLASDRLRRSEARFRLLIEETAQAVWEAAPDGALAVHSPSWEAYTGQSFEEMAGEGWLRAIHPDDRAGAERAWREAIASRHPFDGEFRLRHRGRDWRWTNVRAAPLSGPDGRVEKWVGMNIDITDRKLAEQAAREAALHDPLTGLPNRALVFEYAAHLLAAAARKHSQGAVLFIDLNNFKPVNDRFGHEAGDRLLQEVGRRLVGCVRREDIVGRLGGDEFVVLLPYLDQTQEAMNLAGYIIEAVSAPFSIRGIEVSVPPSIGISLFPQHGETVDALIHAADLAMYQAKLDRRGSYCIYAPALDHQDASSASLEGRLRRALAGNLLRLDYQPVVDLRTGELRSGEALLRFSDEDASIGPASFIPVAESSGLIGAVGEWVATEACRQQAAWAKAGLAPVSISINVSPIQFRQRRFVQRLADIVRESGADPAYLELEIAESTLMDNADDTLDVLAAVKELGLRVALDGIGTGCSNLGRLGALPLDKLKIDRALVRRIGEDAGSRAVVEAVLAVARALALEVVAEGIESDAALSYLKDRGCDRGQGYVIAPPMTGDEFAQRYLRAA